jgi:hypothetical protein
MQGTTTVTLAELIESLGTLSPTELARIVLAEASRLSGLSEDSLRRHYRDKLIVLSERRLGMRVKDALMLHDSS